MSQTMREALEWTAAALQEVFRTNHNCSEHDRIVIGGSSATVREILNHADAALSAPSSEQAQQGADCGRILDKEGVFIGCNRSCLASRPAATAPAVGVKHAELLAYVLQDDTQNRLTPRVIDIAYTAFTLGKESETDWFNDTRPAVRKAIDKLRKDLAALAGAAQGAEPVAEVTHSKPDNYSANHRIKWLTTDALPVGTKLCVCPQPPTGTSQENQHG